MAENVLNTLINQRLELAGQKSDIESQIEDIEQKIIIYMSKNGLEKAENENYKLSLREDVKVVWVDRKMGMDYLEKKGLMSKFVTETFSAPKIKKYLLETGDTLDGTVELNPEKKLTLTAKKG